MVELTEKVGGEAPQHREVQEHEGALFLSYFPGGIEYMVRLLVFLLLLLLLVVCVLALAVSGAYSFAAWLRMAAWRARSFTW